MKLTRQSLLVSVLAALAATRVAAQAPLPPPPDARWDSVTVAWDEGRYPEALNRIIRLLSGGDADQYRERAALLTGEAYVTTALAPDGAIPRWSPDGRFIAWEVGPDTARRTVIMRYENGTATPAAELRGF